MMSKIFLLLGLVKLIFGSDISLIGKTASQSSTWGNQVANLAIDGDPLTFSVAASQGFGWWEVDLGGNYPVGRVEITASYDETNARYLRYFYIWLLKENREEKLCFQYSSSEHMKANETKSFNCESGPFPTRYIRISRYQDDYRPDALALAEVKAYSESLRLVTRDQDIEGYEIPLQGLTTAHSRTWGTHDSTLATDQSSSTFSISCITCDGTLAAGVGWWQVDLQKERQIVGVKITSAPDNYNANYLRDFTVALTQSNTTNLEGANICFDYNSNSEIVPGTTLNLRCNLQPTIGRYLLVRRKETSQFRPDGLALADIQIYESG